MRLLPTEAVNKRSSLRHSPKRLHFCASKKLRRPSSAAPESLVFTVAGFVVTFNGCVDGKHAGKLAQSLGVGLIHTYVSVWACVPAGRARPRRSERRSVTKRAAIVFLKLPRICQLRCDERLLKEPVGSVLLPTVKLLYLTVPFIEEIIFVLLSSDFIPLSKAFRSTLTLCAPNNMLVTVGKTQINQDVLTDHESVVTRL